MGVLRRAVLSLACAAWGLASEASAGATSPGVRVLALLSQEHPSYREALAGFEEGLRERGLEPQVRVAAPGAPLEPGEQLVLALGTRAAQHAATQAASAPIVFTVVGDPVTAGLSDAQGKSLTAATGVSAMAPPQQQLALIAELVPGVRRVGVVYRASQQEALLAAFVQAARAAHLEVKPIAAGDAGEIGPALADAIPEVDAVLALPERELWSGGALKAAVLLSLKHKKPLFGFSRGFVKSGALAALSAEDYRALGKQAAAQAVASARPGAPPRVEAPRAIAAYLNLVIARRLGLEPRRATIARAKEVFR